MIDTYDQLEREAIQWADGIVPKPECEAIRKLEAHRQRVLADRAERHTNKYGIDRKTKAAGSEA